MKDPVISAINAALDAFRANLPTDLHELRAAFEMSLAQLAPPSDMAFEEVTYDRAGAPPLRILLGRGSRKPTRGMLLYLHGGGNVVGSARGFSGLASAIAKCAGTSVALVDFRLAPESPFPAAINDAIDAYKWALSQVGNSNQLVVAGDSAGAALALSVVMNARDNGLYLPAALLLLSPWLDYTLTSSSLHEKASEDHFLSLAQLSQLAGLYLQGTPAEHPLASPLLGDLSNLPPILVQVGTTEVLMDDSLTLAKKAGAAHTPIQLEIEPYVPHVWHSFAHVLPQARDAIERCGSFIERALSA